MGKPKQKKPYFMDSTLLPRVQMYADEQLQGKINKDLTAVLRDVDAVVEHLMNVYPRHYARKGKSNLCRSVSRAVQVILSKKTDQKGTENFSHEAEDSYLITRENGESAQESGEDSDVEEEIGAIAVETDGLVEPKSTNLLNQSLLKNYSSSGPCTPTSLTVDSPALIEGGVSPQVVSKDSLPASALSFSTAQPSTTAGDDPKGKKTPRNSEGAELYEEGKDESRVTKRQRLTNSGKRNAKRLKEGVSRANGGGGGGSKGSAVTDRPTARYKDLGGIESCLQDVRELIEYPLTHPEIYTHLGVEPPRGILLHGPPGTGKTLLANCIAGELGVPFLKISAPEIVSGMSGESEAKIRDLFDEAKELAPCLIFIDEIDAITPKRESAQREMERRIVAQLLTSIDDLSMENTNGKAVIVIGATNRPEALDPALRRAGRFDREMSLGIPDKDSRERHVLFPPTYLYILFCSCCYVFDSPVFEGIPLSLSLHGLVFSILKVICGKLRLAGEINMQTLGQRTPGYVGADLNALAKEAAVIAVNRIFRDLATAQANEHPPNVKIDQTEQGSNPNIFSCPPITIDLDESDEPVQVADSEPLAIVSAALLKEQEVAERSVVSDILRANTEPLSAQQLSPLAITMADFDEALTKVQPSAKREGFATIPDVTWADVGALGEVRSELKMAILEPIRCPEKFAALGLGSPSGVLLYGPPGCGKTLLAKAIANESGASFISIKGPELLNKFVGESERSIRVVFQRARDSAPCVMFFDELDALCPRRGTESHATERVVNQLLTEMDGLESRKQVFIIGATNRPDIIDPAMLRPGRLDKLLYVDLPGVKDRESILQTVMRRTSAMQGIDIHTIACDPRCEGFSGADLAALVREATISALRESLDSGSAALPKVTQSHFTNAFLKVFPSVSKK
eukprot:Ihof_evm4s246 gene=Ihof_evmTU4s246